MPHSSPDELDEERRLIDAAQRNPAQFAALYERHVDRIYAYLYSMTGDPELARDLTAATFAQALEDLPRLQLRGVPYSVGLYRVAATLVVRSHRRPEALALREQQRSREPGPPTVVEQSLRDQAVRDAVSGLPDDQRQAVVLRFGGDLRNREIAQIMGRGEGAVQLLTFRALTALRRQMAAPLPSERHRAMGLEDNADG